MDKQLVLINSKYKEIMNDYYSQEEKEKMLKEIKEVLDKKRQKLSKRRICLCFKKEFFEKAFEYEKAWLFSNIVSIIFRVL